MQDDQQTAKTTVVRAFPTHKWGDGRGSQFRRLLRGLRLAGGDAACAALLCPHPHPHRGESKRTPERRPSTPFYRVVGLRKHLAVNERRIFMKHRHLSWCSLWGDSIKVAVAHALVPISFSVARTKR